MLLAIQIDGKSSLMGLSAMLGLSDRLLVIQIGPLHGPSLKSKRSLSQIKIGRTWIPMAKESEVGACFLLHKLNS